METADCLKMAISVESDLGTRRLGPASEPSAGLIDPPSGRDIDGDADVVRTDRGLTAKVVGGASMFQAGAALNIGRRNSESVEKILDALGIPVVARDVGGESGRRLTLDTATGAVAIRIPGGPDYTL